MLDQSKIAELTQYLTDDELQELDQLLLSDGSKWCPLQGPQTQAWDSKADILFYGGAAGGGKSDFIIGLALEKHLRSIIFRREGTQLIGIIDRINDLLGSRDNFNGQDKIWRLAERQIELGSCPHLGDEVKYQGRAHDLKCFDEITLFIELQFRFLCGWLRSENESVRQRIVCTGNPPTSDEGAWVREFWGPWLDPHHPLFGLVKNGQLLWYTTIDGKDQIRPNGEPFEHAGEIIKPMSRTFIPAKIQDNPYLMQTDYMSKLQAMPEPLRSQMLYGDFTAGTEDHENQCIPSDWIDMSMARWKPKERKGEMTTIGADIARGGADKTVLARRHDKWFDHLIRIDGADTPDGPTCASKIVEHRRDKAPVNIDIIGVGCSPTDFLKQNDVQTHIVDARKTSTAKDLTNGIGYFNVRAECWCKLRDALDPNNPDRIDLPPDGKLKADLTMPRRTLTPRGWKVEPKEDIKKRLGRSPDDAEAVMYANVDTPKRMHDIRVKHAVNYADTDYDVFKGM